MSFYKFVDDDELIQEIKTKLGHPVVKVELDESHWKLVIKNTKRWFMAKKSLFGMKRHSYDTSKGVIRFDEIDPTNGVYKVVNVFPDKQNAGYPGSGLGVGSSYYELLPNGYPLWGGQNSMLYGGMGMGTTSYLMQVYQQIEQRDMITNYIFNWQVQYDHLNGHGLYLTPKDRSLDVLILYKPAILPIDILEGRDAELFYRWALADAKETLGMIRNKYKDYPSAGGTISTDGAELLAEAKENKLVLDEEIAGSQGPMGILVG